MTVRIINADVMDGLRSLPDESVHCVVTSPPYWGLRDYGVEGQIGLEKTPQEFVARMVEVFREVRRVLRKDGVCFVNLGDSYAGRGRTGGGKSFQSAASSIGESGWIPPPPGFKQKDLIGIPWRVALALQDDGWWLRQDIIWNKPNPMPESVTDRCTKAHEYVFHLTKSERYFWDQEAIKEVAAYDGPNSPGSIASPYGQGFTRKSADLRRIGAKGNANGFRGGAYCNGATFDNAEGGRRTARGNRKQDNHENRRYAGFNDRWDESEAAGDAGLSRNKRSVWTIATAPFSEAHFACVDAETECLTSTGWKRHSDLQSGMLAAQYDLASRTLSWAPIEAVARYDVQNQDMVVGSCRDMDMWLTPNHRTIIQRRHPRTRLLQEPVVIRADELKSGHSVPTAADWVFDGDASVSLEWAELLGWYVAEGHESKDSLSVELYQSEAANSVKCRRIEELLRQTGAEWTMATCKRRWRGREADVTAYRIMGYAAVRLREMAPGKRVPWGSVLWSNDRIEALMAGLIGGDGHVRQDARQCFVQKSIDQCGLVQALAMRLGMSATVTTRKDGVGIVYLTKHKTRSFRGANGAGSPPSIQKYTGVVWCPKLPDGTWMARRNGKPFITGNTFPPELPEICIKAGCPKGGTILDPFGGAGTTGLVADRLQRNAILIELNPEYAAMAERRINGDRGALLDMMEAVG